MNRIFKVVWSKSKECYVVVSEVAKNNNGKKKVLASVLAGIAATTGFAGQLVQPIQAETNLSNAQVNIQPDNIKNNQKNTGFGRNSISIGWMNDVTKAGEGSDGRIAIGAANKATHNSSLAVGNNSWSTNGAATAIGSWARATGQASTAAGNVAIANNRSAVAIGDYVNVHGSDLEDCDPNDPTTKVEKKAGAYSTAVGNYISSTGYQSTVIGSKSKATGNSNIAIGAGVQATGNSASIAIGRLSQATDNGSTVIGAESNSTGNNSIAVGYKTNATAKETIVIGSESAASHERGIAIGQHTTALNYNTAIGQQTTASGEGDLAIGDQAKTNTTGTQIRSTAIGWHAETTGRYAVALGSNTKATANDATALGSNSQATIQGSVALGQDSRTTRDKGVAGYDLQRARHYDNLTNSVKTATHAAVSVGNDAAVTRQITGVAAGIKDTDAVNVAQLRNVNVKVNGNSGNSDFLTHDGELHIVGGGNSGRVSTVASDQGSKDSKVAVDVNFDGLVKGGRNVTVDESTDSSGKKVFTVNANVQGGSDYAFKTNAKANGGNLDGTATATTVNNGTTVNYAAGKNLTVKQDINNSTGEQTYTYSLNKDLDLTPNGSITIGNVNVNNNGLTINNGPSITNVGINAGNKQITNVAVGIDDYDAVNVSQLNYVKGLEKHIKPGTYEVQQDGSVTMTYVDGENNPVRNISAKITGIAKSDLSNITNEGKKVITGLGTKVKAGDNVTVNSDVDQTTGQTTYTVNAKLAKVVDGRHTTVTGNGTENNPYSINVNGFENTVGLGGDNSTTTNLQQLDRQGGIKFNILGDGRGNAGSNQYITTRANGDNVNIDLTDDAKNKLNKSYNVTSQDNSVRVTSNTTKVNGNDVTTFDLHVDPSAAQSTWTATTSADANGTHKGDSSQVIRDGKAVDFQAGKNLTVTQTNDGQGNTVINTALDKDLKGLDSVETKTITTNNIKLGDTTNNTTINYDGDRISYTKGGDTYKVANLRDELHITPGTYEVGSKTINPNAANDEVTMSYTDGEGNVVANKTAVIKGIAKSDLSNITNEGKKVITGLGTKVKAGDNVTVNSDVDQTTGQTTYTVNAKLAKLENGKNTTVRGNGSENNPYRVDVQGDVTDITSITNNNGSGKVIFGPNQTVVVNGDHNINLNGKTGDITGLTNVTLNGPTFAQSGRAATEEQLKIVNDGFNNTVGFGADNSTTTNLQQLNRQGGIKFNVYGDGSGANGANQYITTKAAGDNINVDLTDDAKNKLNKSYNVTSNDNSVRVTANTAKVNGNDVTTFDLHVEPGSNDEHITDTTYQVDNNGKVTMTYTDGKGNIVAGKTAVIEGIAKSDLSNITNEGKKVITGLGTKVKAGDNVTVNESSDATTGQTTYTVNAKLAKVVDGTNTTVTGNGQENDPYKVHVQGDLKGITSITNTVGGPTLTFGPNTLNVTGGNLNMGGNRIVNVEAGIDGTDAVNVNQLKAARTVVTSADNSVTVVANENKATGQLTYDLHVKPATGTTSTWTAKTSADANGTHKGDTAQVIADSKAVEFQAGKNLTVTQTNDGQGNTVINTALDKDLKGLDSVETKTITTNNIKLGDTTNNTTINYDGDRISYTKGGDTYKVANLRDELHITPGTYEVGSKTINANAANDEVTMSYTDGEGNVVANKTAVIKGIAKSDLSNITNEGKKVITGLGTKVQAGDRVTVTSNVDNTTGQTTYTVSADKTDLQNGKNTTVTGEGTTANPYRVNVQGDVTDITSITNNNGSGKVTFGPNQTVVVNGDHNINLNGKTGDITGLTNVTLNGPTFAQSGRAATEEQLKIVNDGFNNTVGFGADNSTVTNLQQLNRQGGIKFNVYGDGTGAGGANAYVQTRANGDNINVDLTDDAKNKLNKTYTVVSGSSNVTVTPTTVGDNTEFKVAVTSTGNVGKSKWVAKSSADANGVHAGDTTQEIGDQNAVDFQAGKNLTVTQTNDGNGNATMNYALNKDLKGLDSVETKTITTNNIKLGDTTNNTTINYDGDRISYTKGGDTYKVANLRDELHITPGTYEVGSKTINANAANDEVTMSYTDGEGNVVANKTAVIKGIAKSDLSNITNEGKKVITGLGTKVQAGDRVTVTSDVDNTTGQTTYTVSANKTELKDGTNTTITGDGTTTNPYHVNVQGDLKNITSITNTVGGPTLTFGPNTLNVTGGNLNMGGNRIVNVQAGINDTDVVNVSQLKGARTVVTSADNSVTVVANENKATGQLTYDLHVKPATGTTSTWTAKTSADANGTHKGDTAQVIADSKAVEFQAGKNLTVTQTNDGQGNTVINTALDKDLKGLDSVDTKTTITQNIKLGDTTNNTTINYDGDRISYTKGGDTYKVANLRDELHITPGTYEVGSKTINANAANDEVTMSYTDGEGNVVANKTAVIKGIAKSDLSNITNEGKKVITNLGSKVAAGDNVTVNTDVDNTTGQTTYTVNAKLAKLDNGKNTTITGNGSENDPYKVNVEGDLNSITSITNNEGSGKVTFGPNQTVVVNGDHNINLNGKTGDITGLTNVTLNGPTFAQSGRAATEEQLKIVNDGFNNTVGFGADNSTVTNLQQLNRQGGIKFNVYGDGTGAGGANAYVQTRANGDNINVDLTDDAKNKLNKTYTVVSGSSNVTVTPTTVGDNTEFKVAVTSTGNVAKSKWVAKSSADANGVHAGDTTQEIGDQNAVDFQAGKNLTVTQTNDGNGNTTMNYALNKDLKGLDSIETKTIKLGDTTNNTTINYDGDRISYTKGGDTYKVANLRDEMHITPGTYEVGSKTINANAANDEVTMSYTDGEGNVVANKTAVIKGIAKSDLSNITNEGKKVITGLGTKVQAGDRVTVTSDVDNTTGQTTYTVSANKTELKDGTNTTITGDGTTTNPYHVNVQGDLKNITSITNNVNGPTLTFGPNTLNVTGGNLNMGGNRIVNVQAGINDTDVVNVSQLKGARTVVTSTDNSVTVVANENKATGQLTYDLHVKPATGTTSTWTARTSADANGTHKGDTAQVIADSKAVEFQAGKNLTVTQTNDGQGNTVINTALDKDLKGLDSVETKTITTNNIKLGDTTNNTTINYDGDRISYTKGGDTYKVANLTDEKHITVNNYAVNNNGTVEMTYTDGNGNLVVDNSGNAVKTTLTGLAFNNDILFGADNSQTSTLKLNNAGGIRFNIYGDATGNSGSNQYIQTKANGDSINVDLTDDAKNKLNKTYTVVSGSSNVTVTPTVVGDNTEFKVSVANAGGGKSSSWNIKSTGNTTSDSESTAKTINDTNTVEIGAGKNLTVKQTSDANGAKVELALNNNVDLTDKGSLTIGQTTVNNTGVVVGQTNVTNTGVTVGQTNVTNTGLTVGSNVTVNNTGLVINNGPSVTNVGIDAGSKQIINVKAGVKDTDAVNVSQLKQIQIDVKSQEKHIAPGNYAVNDQGTVQLNYEDGNGNLTNDQVNITGLRTNIGVDAEGSGKVIGSTDPKLVTKGTQFVAGNNIILNNELPKAPNKGDDPQKGDGGHSAHNELRAYDPSAYNSRLAFSLNSDLSNITTIKNDGSATINLGSNDISITGGNLNMSGNKITNLGKGENNSDATRMDQRTIVQSQDQSVKVVESTDANGAKIYDLAVQNGGADPRVDILSREIGKVGAQSAALSALKPIQYDPLEPTQIMAGYGNYHGNSAMALGVAHYKNESTMIHGGVSWGGGSSHMMANAGITWKVGSRDAEGAVADRYRKGPLSSTYAMQTEMAAMKAQNAGLKGEVTDLRAENEEIKAQNAGLQNEVDTLKAQMAAIMARVGM